MGFENISKKQRKPTGDQMQRKATAISEVRDEQPNTGHALLACEFRFRQLVNHMSSGVAVYKAIDRGSDFILLDCNPAAERIDQVDRSHTIGKRLTEIFPAIKEFGLLDVFHRVWKSGTPERHPAALYKDDRILDWRETYVYQLPTEEIVAVYDDLTEQKWVEEGRELSLQSLETILTSMPIGVIVVDGDKKIYRVNPAFVEMLGAEDQSQIVGRTKYADLFQSETKPKSISKNGIEEALLRKDGGKRIVLKNVVPIQIGDQDRFLETFIDITDRKQLEERWCQAKEDAEKATRAKSDFLAMMSHEIRTPMNSILGMAELLGETPLTSEQRRYVETFQAAGESLLYIINDILDISKIEAGQLVLEDIGFNLKDMIDQACALMDSGAQKKGLKLSYDIMPEVPSYVKGDPVRLRQVLINLIGNAIKFTEKGKIEVRICQQDTPVKDGDHASVALLFSVKDTGIGITKEAIDKIFEDFIQADLSTTRKYGGTGLGLSISKRIVQMMQGRIWAERNRSEGTTFKFTAHFETVSSVKTDQPACNLQSRAIKNLHILLAEDNAENVFLIESFLKKTPCKIDHAENGMLAVDKFKTGSYDLVLMDIEMPAMDGYTATRHIRQWEKENNRNSTPVIALTAHTTEAHKQKSIDVGCTAYLTKPIRKADLMEMICSCSPSEASHADAAALAETKHIDTPDNGGVCEVTINPELEPLIPDFLKNRKADADQILNVAGQKDFEKLRQIGHSLKGLGGGYGFEYISQAGQAIEKAAIKKDAVRIKNQVIELKEYLEQVKVVYQ